MVNYVMYSDESGVMMRASKEVENSIACGVVVGILLPESYNEEFLQKIGAVLAKHNIVLEAKSHVTAQVDLDRENLRQDIYEVVKSFNGHVRIVYNVITAIGFHYREWLAENQENTNFNEYLKEHGRALSDKIDNQNAHSEMLSGLILKANCTLEDHFRETIGQNVKLTIKTDAFDEKTKNKAIARYNSVISNKAEFRTAIFNKHTRNKEFVVCKFNNNGLPSCISPCLAIEFCDKTNQGVYCADIISNAIYWHLQLEIAKSLRCDLNTKQALGDFPLKDMVSAGENDFSDKEYGFGALGSIIMGEGSKTIDTVDR